MEERKHSNHNKGEQQVDSRYDYMLSKCGKIFSTFRQLIIVPRIYLLLPLILINKHDTIEINHLHSDGKYAKYNENTDQIQMGFVGKYIHFAQHLLQLGRRLSLSLDTSLVPLHYVLHLLDTLVLWRRRGCSTEEASVTHACSGPPLQASHSQPYILRTDHL